MNARLSGVVSCLVLALVGAGCGTTSVSEVTVVSVGISPAAPTVAAGTEAQLKATVVRSDGSTEDVTQKATWTSSDEAVASVSAEGLVSGHQPGTSVLSATFEGTKGEVTLTVSDATLRELQVTGPDTGLARGTQSQLTATGVFSDGSTQDLSASVAWTSSDPSVVEVVTELPGLVTAVEVGTAVITATDEATGTSASFSLFVTNASLKSLAITPSEASIARGTQQQFDAIGTFSDGSQQDLTSQVVWNSSSPEVASVSKLGLADGVGTGTVTISASLGVISAAANLTVTDATLESIAVSVSSPALAKGTTGAVTATGTFSDGSTQDITAQVTWSSSDPTVADVSNAVGNQGEITALMPGTAVLTALDAASGVSGSAPISITQAELVSIAVTPATGAIPSGETLAFVATGTFSDGSTQDLTSAVLWSSSDPLVLTVSNAAGTRGVAQGVAVGSATLTATAPGTGAFGTASVDVTSAVLVSLEIIPGSAAIARGTTQAFAAAGTFSDGSMQDLTASVTWISSDPSVATLTTVAGSEGLATAVDLGTATITAAASGGITASASLSVTAPTLVSISVTPETASIANGTIQQFVATGTYTDASTQDLTSVVTWASSDTNVATIGNAAGTRGLATGVAVGNATLTATLGAVSGTATLEVTSAVLTSIAVSPTNAAIAAGTQKQFVATGTFSDGTTQDLTASVSWSSSSPSIATVANAAGTAGKASGVGPGSASIVATQGTLSGSATLTVTNAALVSLAVTPTTASIARGTHQQFSATGTFSDGSTQDLTSAATWTSSATAIATVTTSGSRGDATGVAVGTSTLTASVGTISGTATLNVTAATLVSIAVTPNGTGAAAKGTTRQFTAVGTYSDSSTQNLTQSAAWSSADPTVATVSTASGTKGLATAVKAGATRITAAVGAVTGSFNFTVTGAVLTSLSVAPSNPSNALGTTRQFTVTGTYSDGSTQDLTSAVTWSSSDTGVATISNGAGTKGVANTLTAGSSTITATEPLSGLASSTTLTVTNAVLTSIAITPNTASIVETTFGQYTAVGTYSDGTTQDLTATVTWASSDETVATVSNAAGSQGQAQGVAAGSTSITATLSGTTSNAAALTVTPRALVSLTITPDDNPTELVAGSPVQFTAMGNYNDGTSTDLTAAVTWLTSDPSIVTVSNAAGSNGLATGVGGGAATLFAVSGNLSTSITVQTFQPPAVCTTNADPYTGAQYVVCAADGATAWISHASGSGGQFHIDLICQSLGYTGVDAWGGTFGAICGYNQFGSSCSAPGTRYFSRGNDLTNNCGSDAYGPLWCNTVTWECYR